MKASKVVSLDRFRDEKISEKRRKYERVFLKNHFGVFLLNSEGVLTPVELGDLSEEGLSFMMSLSQQEQFKLQEDGSCAMRLYFSESTFLMLSLIVKNIHPCLDGGKKKFRVGCEVESNLLSYQAYKKFVEFLKTYMESSQEDKGRSRIQIY